MPNNCYFEITIRGKPKNIKDFMKLFIFSKDVGKKQTPYLARTFLDSWDTHREFLREYKHDIDNGEVSFMGWCAWSCWSCWFEGYPDKNSMPTIEQACKDYNVDIYVESEEGGMCFEEVIEVKNGVANYSSRDMPT